MEETNNTTEENIDLGKETLVLFKSLPEEFQKALLDIDLDKKSLEIGRDYSLPEEQVDLIKDEVFKVLTTITTYEEFLINISEGLKNLGEKKINYLLDEVNEKIFVPMEKIISEEDSLKLKNTGDKDYSWRAPRETKVMGAEMSSVTIPIQERVGYDQVGKADPYRESAKVDDENLDKEKLLKEIENDDEKVSEKAESVANKDFLKGNIEVGSLEKKADMLNQMSLEKNPREGEARNTEQGAKNDLVGDKLSRPVTIGSEEKELEDKEHRPATKNYKGVVDPYRESVE